LIDAGLFFLERGYVPAAAGVFLFAGVFAAGFQTALFKRTKRQ
jgi:hypothetical protein